MLTQRGGADKQGEVCCRPLNPGWLVLLLLHSLLAPSAALVLPGALSFSANAPSLLSSSSMYPGRFFELTGLSQHCSPPPYPSCRQAHRPPVPMRCRCCPAPLPWRTCTIGASGSACLSHAWAGWRTSSVQQGPQQQVREGVALAERQGVRGRWGAPACPAGTVRLGRLEDFLRAAGTTTAGELYCKVLCWHGEDKTSRQKKTKRRCPATAGEKNLGAKPPIP